MEDRPLSAETIASFTRVIDSILAESDLSTISEKRIRKGLQAVVDYDVTPHKTALKELIMQRFDTYMATQDAQPVSTKKESPVKQELAISTKPDPSDSDARFAAELQAMEDRRSRATRGSATVKSGKIVKKKRPAVKKSKARLGSDQDSDLESEPVERKVNRNSAFHKELMLSTPLSELFDGEIKVGQLDDCMLAAKIQLSRPQSVKRIWQYVRENDLQDPQDKRMIICDERLRPVFKSDKVHMFTMNKILNQNLYPIEG